MTKTMTHTECTHPATKAGRAACRRARKAQEASRAFEVQALRASYYEGTADAEAIIASLRALGIDFDENADLEEVIASI